MTDIKQLVDKFLNWPLPESVCSDNCATIPGYPHRVGTNLLTAVEGQQMLEHIVGPVLVRLKAAEAVCEAVKKVKDNQHGVMFWQCDATPLEDLDDAYAAWHKARGGEP